jgi:hypothetical protein
MYKDYTQCTTVLEYEVVAVLVWPRTRGVGSLHGSLQGLSPEIFTMIHRQEMYSLGRSDTLCSQLGK